MAKRALTIEAVNSRLKAARIGLAVIQRGGTLSLRGTLPPKPGSGKVRPFQQTISLQVYCNPAGLEFAEAKALELGALIAQKRFSWVALEQESQSRDTCEFWVEAFRSYALQNLISQSGPQADLIWREQWWYPALSKLNPDATLTPDAIALAAQQTRANSRSRQVACQKLKRFAEFAGIAVDLKPYLGNYNPRDIQRDIPGDAEIEAAIDSIKNPHWQWVAGMIATYGLRDHECWNCELVQGGKGDRLIWVCRVGEDTKTGSREAMPLPAEWVERWRLWDVRPPEITVRINKEYGERTGRYFARQKIPFTPYSLRHAVAIRASLKYNFPVAIAAKWLGHDPNVYLATYQRHITSAQAMDAFLERVDEP